jgi:hypothetical protein
MHLPAVAAMVAFLFTVKSSNLLAAQMAVMVDVAAM